MRKLAKIVLIGCLSLAAIAVAAHVIWKYSGSGEWQLQAQKNGITIYSLKTPGSTKKKFKGIGRVRATLPTVMASSMDVDICKWAGCYDARMFERVDERRQFYDFRMNYPFHFHPREFVVAQHMSRVPDTQALLVEITAAPEKLPTNDCCVRVEHMNNSWRYTPLKNGELEVEYVIDVDEGGYFPYFLANLGTPMFIAGIVPKMQFVFDREREKFPNPKFELLAKD